MYTDMHTEKDGVKEQEPIPFSMVSSVVNIPGGRSTKFDTAEPATNPSAQENAGDLSLEIKNATSNFMNVKNENQDLKKQILMMNEHILKINEEKKIALELNELKMQ